MPSIPDFLKPKLDPLPPAPETTYYLSPPLPSSTSLRPIPAPPADHPHPIPLSSLLFSLSHPLPASSEATRFFLTCLPDPIGFILHSALFIRHHLTPSSSPRRGENFSQPGAMWRHQLIELELEDAPGLAATSGGKIRVSLHWVGALMREVQRDQRDMPSTVKEFKGVLLHELVHTIQNDAGGTCPGWLIESIADHLRLLAHLEPAHWRKPGVGKRDRGWEEGYDAGARFLAWLTGDEPAVTTTGEDENENVRKLGRQMGAMPVNTAPAPQATRYPPSERVLEEGGPERSRQVVPGKPKPRRGPFPELVRLMDARSGTEKWDDLWWEEMTGAGLDVLWREYLDFYA